VTWDYFSVSAVRNWRRWCSENHLPSIRSRDSGGESYLNATRVRIALKVTRGGVRDVRGKGAEGFDDQGANQLAARRVGS